jgi:hypothetical protein
MLIATHPQVLFPRRLKLNAKQQKHNMKKISGGLFPGETNGGM